MIKDLVIQRGKTFEYPVRWAVDPIVYKPITGITNAAPAVITCTSHGAPDGWEVAVVSVKGMTQINCLKFDKKGHALNTHKATVASLSTIELNDVNASDFGAYTSGGYIQYDTPADLTGFAARMSIKDKVGGTELLSLTTVNGKIVLDAVARTITLILTATETAALLFPKGVYDLELVSPTGFVTAVLSGAVTVSKEVTT